MRSTMDGHTFYDVPIYSERKIREVCYRQTYNTNITKRNIFADEMYSKIRVEWAAAHFDLDLT